MINFKSTRVISAGLSAILIASVVGVVGSTPANSAAVLSGEITRVGQLGIETTGWKQNLNNSKPVPNVASIDRSKNWERGVAGYDNQTAYVNQSYLVNSYKSRMDKTLASTSKYTADFKNGFSWVNKWEKLETKCESFNSGGQKGKLCMAYSPSGVRDTFRGIATAPRRSVQGTQVKALIGNGAAMINLLNFQNDDSSYPLQGSNLSWLKPAVINAAIAASKWKSSSRIVALSVTRPKANAKVVRGKSTAKSAITVTVGKKKYKTKANSKGVWSRSVARLKSKQKITVKATRSGYAARSISIRVR